MPPQNLDAEDTVLGAMMLAPFAIDTVAPILDGADFYRESNGTIYRAAVALHTAGDPVDAITLADQLERDGTLERVGGTDKLHELAGLVPAVSNVAHYARIVVDQARRRQLIRAGHELTRLGQTEPGNLDDLETAAKNLLELVGDRATHQLHPETWHQFESQAHDNIPTIIDGLWPEAAFGFIAAPPKKGKTWVALALAISVATGQRFLNHFDVATPRPVLYVALEGHRAGIRARVGAIARGLGVNPDTDQLDNLHWLYKPAGINLADPVWAQRLRHAAAACGADLIVIDVLRAGARIRENEQGDFSDLRHNLEPITNDGRSIAILHHFVKLSEISRDRDPGERMSGTGAMYGALDAAIYITGSEDNATRLRLHFDSRDLAAPDHLDIQLQGEGTGANGGYTYLDTAAFTVAERTVPDDDLKGAPDEIYQYIIDRGGDVLAKDVRAYFDLGDSTLTRRLGHLLNMGVQYVGGRGKPARLIVTPEPEETDQQIEISDPESSTTASSAHEGTPADEGTFPHNHAASEKFSPSSPTDTMKELKTADMQGKSSAHVPPPYGSAPARTRAHTHPPARETAEQWIRDEGWMTDDPTAELLTRWPTLPTTTIADLTTLAADLAADELTSDTPETTS